MPDYMKLSVWIRVSIVSLILISFLIFGYEINANYVIWILFAIVVLFASLGSNNSIHTFWNKINWQVRTLLTVSAIVVSITIAATLIPKITDATQFMGAFYASWVAGLAFFVVIGIVATIITQSKPENEPFNTRARVLFHNKTGSHIEYIISRLTEIVEHYAENTENKIILREINQTDRKLRMEVEDTTIIRSYIKDFMTTYIARIELSEVTLPPEGCTIHQKNQLLYCRIAGQPQRTFTFEDKIDVDVPCSVEAGKELCVEHGMSFWQANAIEPYTHTVSRFTQRMQVKFESRLAIGQAVRVKFRGWLWDHFQEFVLEPGQSASYVFGDLQPPRDRKRPEPREMAYEFVIEVVDPTRLPA
jgi:hypothetical protein